MIQQPMQGNSWIEDSRDQEDTASHAGKLLVGGFERSRGYSIPCRETPGWRIREIKRIQHPMQGNSWIEDSRDQEDTASHAGKLLDGGFERSRGYSIPCRETPG